MGGEHDCKICGHYGSTPSFPTHQKGAPCSLCGCDGPPAKYEASSQQGPVGQWGVISQIEKMHEVVVAARAVNAIHQGQQGPVIMRLKVALEALDQQQLNPKEYLAGLSSAEEDIKKLEIELGEEIDKRDKTEEWADNLAAILAEIVGEKIGEHSSANNPWSNALKAGAAYLMKK